MCGRRLGCCRLLGFAIDLDKDLLCNEANIYSPETCSFLSHYLNTVFEDREAPNTTLNDDGKYDNFKQEN